MPPPSQTHSPAAAAISDIRGWLGALAAAVLALAATSAPAAAGEVNEYEVKAAALYNILSFIEWPPDSFASDEAPLVLGVLGRGPISDLLDKLAADETWNDRPIVVQRYAAPAEVKACHVLYVDRSSHARWPSIRTLFTGRPILTVSDAERFAREFGMVQLTIERKKLHLIVNLRAARIAGLKISSKVLRLAEVIGEKD